MRTGASASPVLPLVDEKQVAVFQKTVPQIVAQANDLTIDDEDDYVVAGSLLDRIKQRQDAITEFFKEPAKQADNVHKFITGLRSTLLMPLTQCETLIKNRRKDFRAELERKRQALEEEKRKEAQKQEQELAKREAAQMAKIGEKEAAKMILERAATAPPPPVFVPSLIPKEEGKSIRKTWKFRVVNEDEIKREFMMPNESTIQTLVNKLGFDAAKIVGGIEVVPDESETVRRKA